MCGLSDSTWCHMEWGAVPGCPQVHSSIPLSCIRAVERVDEGAFQLPHVMQVVTQDGTGVPHTTYLQCKVRSQQGEGWGRGLSPAQVLTAATSCRT